MTTYTVYKAIGSNTVIIAFNDYNSGINGGYIEVGTFEHDANEFNAQTSPTGLSGSNGDHVFIVKAREVLANNPEFVDLNPKNLVFFDRASNAPINLEETLPLDEVLITSEESSDPNISAQMGGTDSVADIDPVTLAPNGQQIAQECTNEGAAPQDTPKQEKAPQEPVQEPAKEVTKETVAQLKERIATITDKDELTKIREDEEASDDQGRATAFKAIDDRIAELN